MKGPARPDPLSRDQIPALSRLASVGRTRLAITPTPLLPAPGLAASLRSDIEISVKADAWTGLGLGGNKVRKLEYELDPARLRNITHLITAGGPHSNHCRVTAAAAAHLGLGCSLVINGVPEDPGRGNARLQRLLGARIVTVADKDDRTTGMKDEARRIAATGGRALVIPVGASTPRGALGYVHSLVEMYKQSGGDRTPPPWIFTSSSSGGTMGGLILGCAILGWKARLVGVSPDESAATILERAGNIALGAARILDEGSGHQNCEDLGLVERVERTAAAAFATDDFVGPAYGRSTSAGESAIDLFATRAGVILDPVYTGKTAAGMISWIREGRVPAGSRVIFVHTGGHPAHFR